MNSNTKQGITALPWKFERQPQYEERAKLLGQPCADHEGYFRDNDGAWVIAGSDGVRVATTSFKGKAKRGQTWNAPDPEGQANAAYIVLAVNAHEKLVGGLRAMLDTDTDPLSERFHDARKRAEQLLRELEAHNG